MHRSKQNLHSISSLARIRVPNDQLDAAALSTVAMGIVAP
jgi:hypothetical protein